MKRTKKIAAFLILFLCASMLLVLPTSAKSRKKYDLKDGNHCRRVINYQTNVGGTFPQLPLGGY